MNWLQSGIILQVHNFHFSLRSPTGETEFAQATTKQLMGAVRIERWYHVQASGQMRSLQIMAGSLCAPRL